MSDFKKFIFQNIKTNKTYVNLPIGMTEYKDEYKEIVKNFDLRCEFYINLLYKLDKSYLIEMDEWNPESEHSMFNKWNMYPSSPNDNHLPLKTRRTIIDEFNKIMSRYFYCEYLLEKSNEKLVKRNHIIIVLILLQLISLSIMYYKIFSCYIIYEDKGIKYYLE